MPRCSSRLVGVETGNGAVTPGVKREEIDYEQVLEDDTKAELHAGQLDGDLTQPEISHELQCLPMLLTDSSLSSNQPISPECQPVSSVSEGTVPCSSATLKSILTSASGAGSTTRSGKRVSFVMAKPPWVNRVTAYSDIYSVHHRRSLATPRGFNRVSSQADPVLHARQLQSCIGGARKSIAENDSNYFDNNARRFLTQLSSMDMRGIDMLCHGCRFTAYSQILARHSMTEKSV